MSEGKWPTELRVKDKGAVLCVAFDDGTAAELSSELLRVESPSAEVQGHSAREKKIVAGKSGVRILSVEPVGSYAVKLTFSDGHATGIYSWRLLAEMDRRKDELMRDYLAKLAEQRLSR